TLLGIDGKSGSARRECQNFSQFEVSLRPRREHLSRFGACQYTQRPIRTPEFKVSESLAIQCHYRIHNLGVPLCNNPTDFAVWVWREIHYPVPLGDANSCRTQPNHRIAIK